MNDVQSKQFRPVHKQMRTASQYRKCTTPKDCDHPPPRAAHYVKLVTSLRKVGGRYYTVKINYCSIYSQRILMVSKHNKHA